jgi:hypothetical protein
MFFGLGTGLVVVGLFLALGLITADLGGVGDEALGAMVVVVGLMILGAALRFGPRRRVMYVQSSREDRTTR